MINWHFWLATLGIVFYASAMWVAGITQGLMWREYGADGYLVNSFVDTVAAIRPMYSLRAFGGVLRGCDRHGLQRVDDHCRQAAGRGPPG
jgi:cytochrome c oxidase cbb3-type subunit 1